MRAMRALTIPLLSVLSLSTACKTEEETKPVPPPPPATKAPAPATPPPPPEPPKPIKVSGMQTPESVLYDDKTDSFLVSNINGSPFAKDDNGFIARVTPEGTVENAAWIDGKSDKVTLNAPKGMAFMGDALYVSDIDTVRMFDRTTGEPKGEIKIPKASFLNDLVAGADVVYASDTGVKEGFKPAGTDGIWELRGGKPKQIAKGANLGGPNGLALHQGQLWVVSFGTGELYRITEGKNVDVMKLPKGNLDGLVVAPDGSFLIGSWAGQSVFRGKPGAEFTEVVTGVQSPADFALDPKRNRILIPLFEKNEVDIRALDQK